MSTSSIFGQMDDSEIVRKINIDEIIKCAGLVIKIKERKKENDTIIRISKSKQAAFNARINYLKKNGVDVDLFDLAGNSKRQLQVHRNGEKYFNRN